MIDIIFVRHGQTQWNQEGRVQGYAPTSISETGSVQIKNLIKIIELLRPNIIFSSPIIRALESAEILSKALSLKIVSLPELTEFNVGEWYGKTVEELNLTSKSWVDFHNDPTTASPPKGEEILDFQKRVVMGIKFIIDSGKKCNIVVTHAEVIRVAICYFIGLPIRQLTSIRIDTGSLSIIKIHKDRSQLTTLNYRNINNELFNF